MQNDPIVTCDLSRFGWREIEMTYELLKAYNEKSGAAGVYQFLSRYEKSTWHTTCSGDVLRAEDNVRCFMELISSDKRNIKHWWADEIVARALWKEGLIECTDFEKRICWVNF